MIEYAAILKLEKAAIPSSLMFFFNVDLIINGFADVREEHGFDCADLGLCAYFISEISPKSPAKASAQMHHQRLRNGQIESFQLI